MKLKYYLRGMGIGIILTAIVMGFALGGRKKTISDAEVIERAKALGMVEATGGVLSDYSGEGESIGENDKTTSNTSLDEKGKEVSQKVDEKLTEADKSVSQLASSEKESSTEAGENKPADSKDKKPADNKEELKTEESVDTDKQNEQQAKAEETDTKEPVKEEAKPEDSNSSQESNENADNNEASTDQDLANDNTQPPSQDTGFTTSSSKTVTIPGGLSSDAVAAILFKEGLVDNATNFNRYLIDTKKDRVIRSGVKNIPEGATYEEIANILCR